MYASATPKRAIIYHRLRFTTIITAVNTSTMPVTIHALSVSPKSKMHISTAVVGSTAPSMAASVLPTYLAENTSVILLNMVATRVSPAKQKHCLGVAIISKVPLNAEMPKKNIELMSNSQKLNTNEGNSCARVRFTPTI